MDKVTDKVLGKVMDTVRTQEGLGSVEFQFFCRLAPEVDWKVSRLEFRESLTQPTAMTLELSTTDVDADFTRLVGTQVEISWAREQTPRTVNGVMTHLTYLGENHGQALLRVEIGSHLECLQFSVRSRLWQGETVPSIVAAVLDELGQVVPVRSCFQLDSQYETREFVVQFQESDLDFLHRLLESEGISYYIRALADGTEEVVFCDRNHHYPSFATAAGDDSGEEVVSLTSDAGRVRTEELVSQFDWEVAMGFQSTVRREFDWRHPSQISEESRGLVNPRGTTPFGTSAFVESASERVAKSRLLTGLKPMALAQAQRLGQDGAVGVATSDLAGLRAGMAIELSGCARPDLLGRYLVTEVEHSGYCPDAIVGAHVDELEGGKGPSEARYQNRFRCLPIDTAYRPHQITPRARVHGPQTALVVGVSDCENDDIYTDEYGRIRVRFHWDREGQDGEQASCWIRVSQSSAGSGFGSQFIPRVGMEVMVEFLGGDPDRPLVTGCIYNGENGPAFSLPEEKTKSGWRTQSSPEGGGYNELSFDDSSGRESLHIRAQRNMSRIVQNNDTSTVFGDQAETIKKNATVQVGEERSLFVTGNELRRIDGQRVMDVGLETYETYHRSKHEQIRGEWKLGVVADEAGLANAIVCIDKHYDTQCDSYRLDVVGGNENVEIRVENGVNELKATCSHQIKVNDTAVFRLDGDSASLSVDGNIVSTSNGSQTLNADGAIVVTSKCSIVLECGTSSVKLFPDHVVISGDTIVSEATNGENEISGAPITLNG